VLKSENELAVTQERRQVNTRVKGIYAPDDLCDLGTNNQTIIIITKKAANSLDEHLEISFQYSTYTG